MSILKKRDDSEEKTLAQIQLRQSKRRVRFQEMEETLEQGTFSSLILTPELHNHTKYETINIQVTICATSAYIPRVTNGERGCSQL